MNKELKMVILNAASLKISELQKIFKLSFEKIKIELDEKSDIGSGYFKADFKNKIFLVTKYFEYREDINKIVSNKAAHEFCHLYVNDNLYLDGGTFNKDIEKKLMQLIDKLKIIIKKNEYGKYDISKLISQYAYDSSKVNQWHEVLCEAFSQFFCYDYIKNEEALIKEHSDTIITFDSF